MKCKHALSAVLLLSLSTAIAVAAPIYTSQELLPLPGDFKAHGFALNGSGQVVGYSLSSDGTISATLWRGGVVYDLSPKPKSKNFGYVAFDINDLGKVVGIGAYCEPSCGEGLAYYPAASGAEGTAAVGWQLDLNTGVALLSLPGCDLDDHATLVSNADYVALAGGIIPPAPSNDVLCFFNTSVLFPAVPFENGVVSTPSGWLYHALVDTASTGDPPQYDYRWVLAPSCAAGVRAYFALSGPPNYVSDAVKTVICDLASTGFSRNRHENSAGQVLMNDGDKAFLLSLAPTDSDGDGIPDTQDSCPNGNLSATVVLGTCDSHVPNRIATNGCTIIDSIDKCSAMAKNHGALESCAAKYLNSLVPMYLSDAQRGKIQSCVRVLK